MTEYDGFSVHPVADLFPMLPDDELADLAADIAERGLLQPIVLDTEGRILDGRNRYAACQLAGVEPTFTTYNGDDPEGYPLAVNIARRHLSKGQQAMVVARAVSETDTGLSREKRDNLARQFKISRTRIGEALATVKHAPNLVLAVVAGTVPLDKAYETARQRKQQAESTENQMIILRNDAPDLAGQVVEERLSLPEALAALRARVAQRENSDDAADDPPPAVASKPSEPSSSSPPKPRTKSFYNRSDMLGHGAAADLIATFNGYEIGLKDITSIDPDVTPDQNRRWATDLSRFVSCVRKLESLMKERGNE